MAPHKEGNSVGYGSSYVVDYDAGDEDCLTNCLLDDRCVAIASSNSPWTNEYCKYYDEFPSEDSYHPDNYTDVYVKECGVWGRFSFLLYF